MFQLTRIEYNVLRFQIGMIEKGAHSKYLPYAFTEHRVTRQEIMSISQTAISFSIKFAKNGDVFTVEEIKRIIEIEQKPKPKIGFQLHKG